MTTARSPGTSTPPPAARHPPWRALAAAGVVGLVLAVAVLDGPADGIVATLSVAAVLWAIAAALEEPRRARRRR